MNQKEMTVDQFLHTLFYEDWMGNQYEQMIDLILNEANITKQELSGQLQTGFDNGHSIDDQALLVKSLLNLGEYKHR